MLFYKLGLSSKGSLQPSNEVTKALEFLRKGGQHQILRKEIQFALMPTTLKGLSEKKVHVNFMFILLLNRKFQFKQSRC